MGSTKLMISKKFGSTLIKFLNCDTMTPVNEVTDSVALCP